MNVRMCPKCHNDNIQYQTVNEQKRTGCLMVLIYIILAISCIGWLILIPLLVRKKTKLLPMQYASHAVTDGKYKSGLTVKGNR